MSTSCRGMAHLHKQRLQERRLLLPESGWTCYLGYCHACQISLCEGAGALQHTALTEPALLDTENELLPHLSGHQRVAARGDAMWLTGYYLAQDAQLIVAVVMDNAEGPPNSRTGHVEVHGVSTNMEVR